MTGLEQKMYELDLRYKLLNEERNRIVNQALNQAESLFRRMVHIEMEQAGLRDRLKKENQNHDAERNANHNEGSPPGDHDNRDEAGGLERSDTPN